MAAGKIGSTAAEDVHSPHAIMVAVGLYSMCSASMLIVNQLTMFYIPSPGAVILAQLVFAALAVLAASSAGLVAPIEFRRRAATPYALYTAFFCLSVYSNMQALNHTNVDTVIIFRSCSPLAVSITDYIFMGRELPSTRSFLALGALVVGAYVYATQDSQLAVEGIGAYFWTIIYFFAICTEMTVGKQVTKSIKVSLSTSVFYTNAFSSVPIFLISYGSGEDFSTFSVPHTGAFVMLMLSCRCRS